MRQLRHLRHLRQQRQQPARAALQLLVLLRLLDVRCWSSASATTAKPPKHCDFAASCGAAKVACCYDQPPKGVNLDEMWAAECAVKFRPGYVPKHRKLWAGCCFKVETDCVFYTPTIRLSLRQQGQTLAVFIDASTNFGGSFWFHVVSQRTLKPIAVKASLGNADLTDYTWPATQDQGLVKAQYKYASRVWPNLKKGYWLLLLLKLPTVAGVCITKPYFGDGYGSRMQVLPTPDKRGTNICINATTEPKQPAEVVPSDSGAQALNVSLLIPHMAGCLPAQFTLHHSLRLRRALDAALMLDSIIEGNSVYYMSCAKVPAAEGVIASFEVQLEKRMLGLNRVITYILSERFSRTLNMGLLPDNNEAAWASQGWVTVQSAALMFSLQPVDCIVGAWHGWVSSSCPKGDKIYKYAREAAEKRCKKNTVSPPPLVLPYKLALIKRRSVVKAPNYGGKACPATITAKACWVHKEQKAAVHRLSCPLACELGAWSSWSACPVSCEVKKGKPWWHDPSQPTHRRQRNITRQPKYGGPACGVTVQQKACNAFPCPVDCQLSKWLECSACSVECSELDRVALVDTRMRGVRACSRVVMKKSHYGGRQCPLNNATWVQNNLIGRGLPCRSCCGKIECEEKREKEQENLEKEARAAQEALNATGGQKVKKAAILDFLEHQDCKVGDWSEWQGCTSLSIAVTDETHRLHGYHLATPMMPVTCGAHGQRQRVRVIVNKPSGGEHPGKKCPALSETRSCSLVGVKGVAWQPCPVDCVLSDWHNCEVCSATCGGGSRVCNRDVVTQDEFGGKRCPDTLEAVLPCHTKPCPGPPSDAPTAAPTSTPAPTAVPTTAPTPPLCNILNFSAWGACSASCGKAVQHRSPALFVNPLFPHLQGTDGAVIGCRPNISAVQTRRCYWLEMSPCPIDCELEDLDHDTRQWPGRSSYCGPCSENCGGGQSACFTKRIVQKAMYGGRACPPQRKMMTMVPCNRQPCPKCPGAPQNEADYRKKEAMSAANKALAKIWDETNWTSCSAPGPAATCGIVKGMQYKRIPIRERLYSLTGLECPLDNVFLPFRKLVKGKSVFDPVFSSRACHVQSQAIVPFCPEDCQVSPWEKYRCVVVKCYPFTGHRVRWRTVLSHAKYGGKRCPSQHEAQTDSSGQPVECHQDELEKQRHGTGGAYCIARRRQNQKLTAIALKMLKRTKEMHPRVTKPIHELPYGPTLSPTPVPPTPFPTAGSKVLTWAGVNLTVTEPMLQYITSKIEEQGAAGHVPTPAS